MEIQKTLHLYKELEKKKPNINHVYMVQPKLDGWYVYVDKINGVWDYPKSSAGRVIPAFAWMKEEEIFDIIDFGSNIRVIFEATLGFEDFSTLNGVFNRSVGDVTCRDVSIWVHDFVLLDNPFSLTNYQRYEVLEEWGKELQKQPYGNFYHIKNIAISDNIGEWHRLAEDVWDAGGEGIILKQTDAIYAPGKRNSSLMKIKLENEADLLCVKMYETIGEKGNINLNVDLQSSTGIIVPVRVGKISDQTEFKKNSPVGKVCKIRYMKQLPSGSYREPRFVCVRHDKSPCDID